LLAVIAPASAPPSQKPLPKAWRMFRTSRRSSQTKLACSASSYEASAPGAHGVRPRWSAPNAASAASRPDSIA
jgi:hypothetical protein